MSSDSEGSTVLAIDIGNTRVHYGIIDIQNLQCIETRTLPIEAFREQSVTTVIELFERNDKTFSSRIIIAGVVKSLTEIARSKLEELFPERVTVAKFTSELPFKCNYKKQQALGIDRLADALYSHTACQNKNCIIIDTGTAIKIDLLHNNEYSGGTILPGLRTQLQSLNESTDALPDISLDDLESPLAIPGLTTEDCISAGVIYGAAGAIERIVNEMRKYSSDAIILATGGDWEFIAPYISIENTKHIPDMTLIGTALFLKYLN